MKNTKKSLFLLVNPAVITYFKAEKDSFATFFIATDIISMTKVVHLAAWSANLREMTATLESTIGSL